MPKFARHRTDNVLTMPSLESPTAVAIAAGVTESDIARAPIRAVLRTRLRGRA